MSEVYIYLVVIIFVLWVVNKLLIQKGTKWFCISVGIVLFFVLGLRRIDVGVDLDRYSYHFENVARMKEIKYIFLYSDLNPAYYLSNHLFARLGLGFQVFVFFTSFICISTFTYYVIRYSRNPLISFISILGLGVFTFWFSGLKQSLAMSFSLLYIDSYLQSKYRWSIFWLLISVLFHWTSLVLLPLFFVGRINLTKMVMFLYVVFLVILLLFSRSFGETITMLLVEDYVDHYESSNSLGGTAILSLLTLGLYYFFVYDAKKKNHVFLFHGMIILCMIQICSSYAYAFTRINYYYMMGILSISVSMISDRSSLLKSKKQIGIIGIPLFYVAWVSMMIYLFFDHVRGERIYLYSFMWQ